MQLNPIATEQTTAATDLLLTVAAIGCLLYLRRYRAVDPWRIGLWRLIFTALAIGSALAAAAHGLLLPAAWQSHLWSLIYLALGLMVSGFAVAAVHGLAGQEAARRAGKLLGMLVLLLLVVVKLLDDAFAPFLLFEAAAMLFALAIYAYLGWIDDRRHARWMVAGILLTLLAAAMQALRLGSFVWIWPFDHNGTFHLVQLVGLGFIMAGLRLSLRGD